MTNLLSKISIGPDISIRRAVEVLNEGHQRIVLIVDGNGRLIGVVADSDIRRAILKGLSFELPVSEIMVTRPVVASVGMPDRDILALMQATQCHEIPVLDAEGRVVDLRAIDSLMSPRAQPADVIVMAGGLGRRLLPATESVPKPLLQVGAKPILFLLLDQLLAAGFRKITLALNHQAEMIRGAVESNRSYQGCVCFVQERRRLGTAGALSLLDPAPTEPFLVINADLLTNMDFAAMLRFHALEGYDITIAVRQEQYQIPLGVVRLAGALVEQIEEKPTRTYFASAGVYVLGPEIPDFVPRDAHFDMPDLINDVIRRGRRVGSFPVHEYWLDIGSPSELQRAQAAAGMIFSATEPERP
jgi:dTDP-glucose pyrophosphorylase